MRLARIGAVVALTAGLVAAPVAASGRPMTAVTPPPGLTMEAAVLLDGHARIGSWMAIDVQLKNDGPPIVGELRLTGGTQGTDALRDPRRAADPVRQDPSPVRPAAGLRA